LWLLFSSSLSEYLDFKEGYPVDRREQFWNDPDRAKFELHLCRAAMKGKSWAPDDNRSDLLVRPDTNILAHGRNQSPYYTHQEQPRAGQR